MRATTRAPATRILCCLLLCAVTWWLAASSRAAAAPALQPGDTAVVRADGDCLRLHTGPALADGVITCLPEGTLVTVLADGGDADGYHWLQIRGNGYTGWAVDAYLQTAVSTPTPVPTVAPTVAPTPAATATPSPATGAPVALPAPPVGGLTLGMAGTSDPAALAAAQSFPVESVSVLDVATQRFLVYVPGAPAYVNSLTPQNLHPTSIATVKRQGDTPAATSPPPAAARPLQGTGNALPTPLPGGLTQGVSATNDPATLAAAQRFHVETISMLDVPSQAWLVYIPGAPAAVDTLNSGSLAIGAVVTIKSSAGAPAAPPAGTPTPAPSPTATPSPTPSPTGTPVGGYTPAPPATATAVPGPAGNQASTGAVAGATVTGSAITIRVTYYYCTPGRIAAGLGDGGGFCGTTASGEPVHRGGASCAPTLLGQRFTVVGDPDHLVYTCTDTGSAVRVGVRDFWFADSDSGYAWWQVVGPTATIHVVAT